MKRIAAGRGMSLLEAVIAVGIFVASMAMIGQLLDTGLRLVGVDKRQTMGLLRAESVMEEIVAGIRKLELPDGGGSGTGTPTESVADLEDPRWRARVAVEPTEVERLARVTVIIEYFDDPESTAEEGDYRQELTRLVLMPTSAAKEDVPSPMPAAPGKGAASAPVEASVPEMLGLAPAGGGP